MTMDRPPDRSEIDPTALTTQAILREVTALRDIVFTRFEAMDKAMALFSDNLTRVPTDTDKQVGNLKELHQEKFDSIQVQFSERDVRVEQTAKDTKVAVDAALQAAEKAVEKQNEAFSLSINKSEAATLKQIDGQAALIQSATSALNDKIDDIKERLTRIEGAAVGTITEKTTSHQSSAWVLALALGAISLVGLLIVIARDLIVR